MIPASKRFGLLHTLRCLYSGQSLMRIEMNTMLAQETICGMVVDVGGARNPDYFEYFQSEGSVRVERVDGAISGIDFEKDALPFSSGSADTVILCNVLEHIYNYQHLTREIRRILVPGGKLIGVVPFWVGYHPDPHDYFRYTHEALEKILEQAGFTGIKIRSIGGGPVLANFNTIVLSVPRIFRPVLHLFYAFGNRLFVFVRPESIRRHPLGFVFAASVN